MKAVLILGAVVASLVCPTLNQAQTLMPDSPASKPNSAEDALTYASKSQPSIKTGELKEARSLVRFSKKRFFILSTMVYAAGFADMHQTLAVRNQWWWYETDPLAKPFAKLPAPAYYVTGLVMATGVNFLGWKMAHSTRWHRLALIPQILTIVGNSYGLKSNV
jgi:hypothetical protein